MWLFILIQIKFNVPRPGFEYEKRINENQMYFKKQILLRDINFYDDSCELNAQAQHNRSTMASKIY